MAPVTFAEHQKTEVTMNDKVAADQIAGDTIEEIDTVLGRLNFDAIKRLLVAYECSIGELAHKILRAKGLKDANDAGNNKQDRKPPEGQGEFAEIG